MAVAKADYVKFTKEMRREYTILVPTMLPIHFKLISNVLVRYGYKVDFLEEVDGNIKESGLRYVHNDTCYPALLVIGQLINAVESGRYDKDKIALLITQTGGGCRASNYIYLRATAISRLSRSTSICSKSIRAFSSPCRCFTVCCTARFTAI